MPSVQIGQFPSRRDAERAVSAIAFEFQLEAKPEPDSVTYTYTDKEGNLRRLSLMPSTARQGWWVVQAEGVATP